MRPSRSPSSQRGPDPVVAGGRRVPLVENEVQDRDYGRHALAELNPARDFEGYTRLGQRPLRPDDALGDGRLGDEEGTGDFLGRQPPKQSERQGYSRLLREDWMAGDKQEAQEVVADRVIERRVECLGSNFLPLIEPAAYLILLALEALAPPQEVDRVVLAGREEPGRRLVGNA